MERGCKRSSNNNTLKGTLHADLIVLTVFAVDRLASNREKTERGGVHEPEGGGDAGCKISPHSEKKGAKKWILVVNVVDFHPPYLSFDSSCVVVR